jgi:D-glycero-D-manno-heptose 1,7-bisphosphate phosphatase
MSGTTDSRRRAAFLDRDGTIIKECNYLADPGGVVLVDGAAGAIAAMKNAGLLVVVVTNQSGIARGLYTQANYTAVAARLDELLLRAEAPVDATYYCPHHPDFSGPCDCRKPGLGMYRVAARTMGIELAESFYVGDRLKDVVPALTLGGQGILVRTGHGAGEEAAAPDGIRVADDLPSAAEMILTGLPS